MILETSNGHCPPPGPRRQWGRQRLKDSTGKGQFRSQPVLGGVRNAMLARRRRCEVRGAVITMGAQGFVLSVPHSSGKGEILPVRCSSRPGPMPGGHTMYYWIAMRIPILAFTYRRLVS